MESEKTWLEDLAGDLLHRQVDTIVTDGITGRGMPHPVIALLDIHNSYLRKLVRIGKVPATGRDWPAEAHDHFDWLLPNVAAEQWLVAKALEALHDDSLKGVDRCVLMRIVATCTSLMPIVARLEREHADAFNGKLLRKAGVTQAPASSSVPGSRLYYTVDWSEPLPEVSLKRKEHAALSKAWELGSDTVALQTVSTLDGDIITRVTEEYTRDAHGVVRQIHREAVSLSLTTWELLVKGVSGFLNGLFRRKAE